VGVTRPKFTLSSFRSAVVAGFLVVLLSAISIRGESTIAKRTTLPILTNVEQIRRLTPEQANLGYPVHMQGVVTYYDAETTNPPSAAVFVQDDTGGIALNAPVLEPKLKAGQIIDLEGVAEAPDFAPQIGNPRWRVIGEAPLPKPRRVALEDMLSTAEDSRWVEIEGIVRQAGVGGGFITLDVAVLGGRLKAQIPGFRGPVPERLLDAEVRIRGVCGALYNQKYQLIGILLYVPDLKQVDVLSSPPADPFQTRLEPLSAVQRFAPQRTMGHRIRTQGRVILQIPGKSFYISDGKTGLRIDTRQAITLKPGDNLDVVGFPRVSDFTLTLEDAVCRLNGSMLPPTPIPVTADQILRGDYDSLLVSIDGRLLEKSAFPGRQTLVLKTETTVFDALIRQPETEPTLVSLRPDSILRLTGVCLVQQDGNGYNQSFQIVLRSKDDILVTQLPPWWTARRALAALGLLTLGVLMALAWVAILRHKVQSQTELIRRKLEREAAAEQRQRLHIQQTPLGVIEWNTESLVVSWNPAAERIFGYTAAEAVGQHFSLIVPQAVKAQVDQVWSNLLKRTGGERSTNANVTKDGRVILCEWYNTPLTAPNGNVVGAASLVEDITARKLAEQEIIRAKEAAEAASLAKSEFVANMSHEIRTPMNGIVGMTALALDTELTPEQHEYLSMVKGSADSLLTVINDILDFSKIEAGRLELESMEFDLRDCLGQVIKSFALLARQKDLEFNCQVHPDVPSILIGDPNRLRQILVNLIGNAIKFTERGQVSVEVETESLEGDGVMLHFAVQDTGIGIPFEKQARIFESFTQADGSMTRRYGGTGLGLTITRRLVELTGGQIWVESEFGRGSTFHFTTYLTKSVDDIDAMETVPYIPSNNSSTGTEHLLLPKSFILARPQGLRILLAEDNRVNQRLAVRLLEKRGHQVMVACHGKDVLAALEAHQFDLVLMDVQMPEMDGFETTAAIRAKEKNDGGHLPIIAMTALTMKGDRERCLASGMDGYVLKPIRTKELFSAIEAVITASPPAGHSENQMQSAQ